MKVVRVVIPYEQEQTVKMESGGYSVSLTLPEECKRVVSLTEDYSNWYLTYEA